MNRYWSHFSQQKISAGKGPNPGNGDGGKKMYSGEKTASWKVSIGPASKNLNKIGWPEVKNSPKKS